MGNNFINRNYAEKIEILTSRAKDGSTHTADLDIGESCYLLSLLSAVKLCRMKGMSSDELGSRASPVLPAPGAVRPAYLHPQPLQPCADRR